jgi:hypothetical protein
MSDIGKRFPFDAYPKGWFQVAGSNAEIPYAKTVNRTARLREWPTVERSGGIFVRHSEASTEPEWELPKIPRARTPRSLSCARVGPLAPSTSRNSRLSAAGPRRRRDHRVPCLGAAVL